MEGESSSSTGVTPVREKRFALSNLALETTPKRFKKLPVVYQRELESESETSLGQSDVDFDFSDLQKKSEVTPQPMCRQCFCAPCISELVLANEFLKEYTGRKVIMKRRGEFEAMFFHRWIEDSEDSETMAELSWSCPSPNFFPERANQLPSKLRYLRSLPVCADCGLRHRRLKFVQVKLEQFMFVDLAAAWEAGLEPHGFDFPSCKPSKQALTLMKNRAQAARVSHFATLVKTHAANPVSRRTRSRVSIDDINSAWLSFQQVKELTRKSNRADVPAPVESETICSSSKKRRSRLLSTDDKVPRMGNGLFFATSKIKDAGMGLFAEHFMPNGSIVAKYFGHRVSDAATMCVLKCLNKGSHIISLNGQINFLDGVVYDEHMKDGHCLQLANDPGKAKEFLNIRWHYKRGIDGEDQIYAVATRDIEIGEELYISYGCCNVYWRRMGIEPSKPIPHY